MWKQLFPYKGQTLILHEWHTWQHTAPEFFDFVVWTSKDPPTSLPHIPKKEKILNINKRNRELTAIIFTDHFHLLFSFIFHASWKSSLYWGAVSTRKQALKILKAANCVNCWLLNIGWNIWFSLKRIKPHLHALKNRHGTPSFRRVNVSVPNVMWHQCSKF